MQKEHNRSEELCDDFKEEINQHDNVQPYIKAKIIFNPLLKLLQPFWIVGSLKSSQQPAPGLTQGVRTLARLFSR